MPKFMLIYHDGKVPETPEEGEKVMAAWGKWMSDHEKSIADPGNPVGMSKTVDKSGTHDGAKDPAYGYSVVEAADMDAACAIASENPVVGDGGRVEVAEIVPIEM